MKDINKREQGSRAEDLALEFLQAQGLRLVARNYKTPGRGGGEVDLIMAHGDTLVFVEVRQRAARVYGGAAASVRAGKQRRVIFAAQHYLLRLPQAPPCRFDVVSLQGDVGQRPSIEWLPAAFDAPAF